MKKLLGTALILSMLGGSAAVAAPHGYAAPHGTTDRGYRAQDNSGAIVAGIGLLMLGAFLASQNDRHDVGYQHPYPIQGPNPRWNQDRDNGWDRSWNQNQYKDWDDRGGYDNRQYDRGYDYRGH